MEDEEYACSLTDLVATLTATAVSLHRSRRSHQASVLSSTEVVGHFQILVADEFLMACVVNEAQGH